MASKAAPAPAPKPQKGSLTSSFMFKAAVGVGLFFATGLVDYSFFHNNMGGQALVGMVDPFLQETFDFLGLSTIGVSETFQACANPTILPSGALGCAPGM